MAGILKVDQYQDFNGNNIMTSDGSGNVTVNTTGLKNTPAFSVSASTTTTCTSGAYTVIQYNTKEFDTDTKFNTSGYYYEIPTTGKYQINIQMRASNQNNSQYYYGIALYKDTSSGFGSETQIAFQRYLSGYANHTYSPEVNHHLVDCMSFTAGEFLRAKWYISGGNDGGVYGNDSGQPRSSTWSMTKLIGA
jgi:uncharacterized protein YaiE (UPF0345 family)